MTTIQQAISSTEQALLEAGVHFGHGTDNAWDEAVFLTLGVCDLALDSDSQVLSQTLTEDQLARLDAWMLRRIEHREPLPYLLGYTWFAGVQISVEKGVIVPRSPIAEMIVNGFAPFLPMHPATCLDLCAGSGCIGIASALHLDINDVDLVEIDPQAVALANKNISAYELEERVRVIESDLFASLDTRKRYDLIVSNPPYVDASDFAAMPEEFAHEPSLALVSGHDGLDITARILVEAANRLSDGGVLVVEVGNSEVALQDQLPNVPFAWVEFAGGGNGVFVLTAQQCIKFKSDFVKWVESRIA